MSSLRLENVTIDFPIYSGSNRSMKQLVLNVGTGGRIAKEAGKPMIVRALENVSVEVKEGDRLGLIGHNGSGKTTLLRAMAGVYEPVLGSYWCDGRITPLFDAQLGMDIEATGYENIIVRGLYMGLRHEEIETRLPEIAEFTELGNYLAMPVRTYSSGMMLRLAFAVSTCVTPEILLMDEWIGVGDPGFLAKAQQRMETFVSKSNIMVLATHNRELLNRVCNRVVQLQSGRVKASGTPHDFDEFFASLPSPAAV
jgi:ABC-2 type transport system ATP-binding protein/lipopolysaccharide transport system ATP-binding protein